ncbi:MAG: hypothetical protein Q9Q40_07660 [Acidobacteriota bacterium]|nr:hypothetical protein [Acidobacteriota bacterium]MDQ7088345.1 hypothetical protein [Acidobacteriota bacterium]
MTSAWETARDGGLLSADLSHWGLLAVSGADATTFLHNQLTCQVKELGAARSTLGAYCNPKGRVVSVFRLFRKGDAWILRLPGDVAGRTRQRLELYRLRARVEIEDARPLVAVIGVGGGQAPARLKELGLPVPGDVDGRVEVDDLVVLRVPGLFPRFELYCCPSRRESLWEALGAGSLQTGPEIWQALDLHLGLAPIHESTSERFVPQALRLDEVGAVSFSKGCFPGQEVVSRLHHLGSSPRIACLLLGPRGSTVEPGTEVFAEGRVAGTLLEGWPDADGHLRAMAVVGREALGRGELRWSAADGAVCRVLDFDAV